jgi:hypothetical protein
MGNPIFTNETLTTELWLYNHYIWRGRKCTTTSKEQFQMLVVAHVVKTGNYLVS